MTDNKPKAKETIADLGALVEGTAVAFGINRPDTYLVYLPGALESIRNGKCIIIRREANNLGDPRIATYTAVSDEISLSPKGEIRINGNFDVTYQFPKDEDYAVKDRLLTRAGFPLPLPGKFERSDYIIWGC